MESEKRPVYFVGGRKLAKFAEVPNVAFPAVGKA